MQLSEMEEEMDQRIHAAERKTRDQVGPAQTRRICSSIPSNTLAQSASQHTSWSLTRVMTFDLLAAGQRRCTSCQA